jgi:hypothetical protein
MKIIALSILSSCACLAAIGNFRVLGTTATQALIAYNAPDGNACTLQVSQSSSLAPPALDLDPGTFANANADLSRPSTVTAGLTRIVVLGQRTSQYASAGTYSGVRHFSRALQTYTPYFGQITCPSTGDTLPFTFTTSNIPLGQTYGDPWLSDPTHPGDQPWPEALGGLTPESFIDPLTGTYQYRIGLRGNAWTYWAGAFGSALNLGQANPCDTAGPWTSPCSVTAASGSTTVGNSTAPLVIRPFFNANYGSSWYGSFTTLDQLSVSLTGFINSTNPAYQTLNVCLSLNGGASCASSVAQMSLSQSSSQQTVGQAPATAFSAAQFGTIPWLLDTNPRFNMQEASPHSGTGTVSGNTVANNPSTSGYPGSDFFSLYWVTGGNGHIRLSANNDACITPPASTTSTEYAISGFVDGSHLTVAGTPPAGNVYWCENNFAIVVWRAQAPTDGSTVTLTAASMHVMSSGYPGYPDNGAGTACFSKLVYGGYFCLFGNLYWINPVGPVVAYYGQPEAAGVNGSGTPIANSWTRTTAPTPESASIDQTQSQLTFYMMANDPAGSSPLVIQGLFNPGSTPTQPTSPQSDIGVPQIQNATVASTTAYSVTWNNGLTFTNLTPQTTMAASVFQQMASFDPTFIASYYSGLNCALTGAMSTGVFYFACYSLGGDSPAWVFAFSPGDGNPAHAGLAGGPQIVGAINTFNTPPGPVAAGQGALTGRSLHAIAETGESGWLAVDGNEYDPINTSATTIPASGLSCSTYGLAAGNDCYLIQINSHTVGSVTGYEPYFAHPSAPFLGTPGELRTTQIGDTACVTTLTAGTCTWYNQTNELMTLKIKNYGGVTGAWVFQRNTYGAERAVTGPISLWWESYQSSVPPSSVGTSGAVQIFWNPLAGCNGSPDPHGNCLIEDPNEYHGHVEWRNGGESQVVNVPIWKVPGAADVLADWPNIYQTLVGSVTTPCTYTPPNPCILAYPPANVTPNVVSGVNYVQSSTPFAGAYGVPFQPDGGGHPNAAGVNAGPYETIRAFDNVPIQGGSYNPRFTLVSGQLYYYRPTTVIDPDDFYTAGTAAYINRKLMATGASCGSHPLIDISAPGSSISTGTPGSYTYCVARANGECSSSSLTGDVYVNCPGVLYASCSGVATHGGVPLGVGNDICVGNIAKEANAITQFTLDRTDYAGAFSRVLVSATSRLRMVTGFEGNQLLPDNSWILYRQEFLNYQRPDMWMAMYPPYPPAEPGGSVDRGNFIPITVTLSPPAGLAVNNAIVKFGYQEYGAPQALNCTTRHDACIAAASSVPSGNLPFYFASENPAGLPCASGCTIAIPAISQRILYYQVTYRAANNSVLSADPITSVVVP